MGRKVTLQTIDLVEGDIGFIEASSTQLRLENRVIKVQVRSILPIIIKGVHCKLQEIWLTMYAVIWSRHTIVMQGPFYFPVSNPFLYFSALKLTKFM